MNGRPPLTMPAWYVLVAIVVSLMLLATSGVVYTNWSIRRQYAAERESDRRWCQLLATLDHAYQGSPPQTELGRRLAADIHALRAELGCAP